MKQILLVRYIKLILISFILTCNSSAVADEVSGDDSNNVIIGTSSNDIIIGFGGQDTLVGNPGNDKLYGGAGNDELYGGAGIDEANYISADSGVNVNLQVTGEQDTLSAGIDTLTSIENLTGSNHHDMLTGDDGENFLRGGDGNDTLLGSGGDDTLIGGAGNDILDGGDESDSRFFEDHSGDAEDASPGDDDYDEAYHQGTKDGSDTASYITASSGVVVQLDLTWGHQNTVGAGWDKLISIENLVGSTFNDTLKGDEKNNSLFGGSGDDTLFGFAGEDDLFGGNGNDRLSGGDGGDRLYGGDGNDFLIGGDGDDSGFDFLQGGLGQDTASYISATSGVTVDLSIETHQNTGGAGSDTLRSIENLRGSIFDDTLTGDDNDNVLESAAGNDALFGHSGNDTLQGGNGSDMLDGGLGQDTASYSHATSGVNVNLQVTGEQDTLGAGIDTLTSIEHLTGSNHHDMLTGHEGDNVLFGAAGNDTLIGAGGDDTLIGGAGNNSLNGGSGNDVYVFSAITAQDTITETSGNDQLKIQYTHDADSLTYVYDKNNLRIENAGGGHIDIVNQFSGNVDDAVEDISVGSTDNLIHLSSSFEELVTMNSFDQYALNSDLTTQRNMTIGSTLTVRENSVINNNHTLANHGQLNFMDDSALGGTLINNGAVNIADDKLLILTGIISGSGSFNGDTFLHGAILDPGNSPGALMFNGDTIFQDNIFNLEIGRGSNGELLFDQVIISGDLTLQTEIDLSFSLLNDLSWDDLVGESFDFFNVAGSVLDGQGATIELFDWLNFSAEGWALDWRAGSHLSLYAADEINVDQEPITVYEPATWILLLGGLGMLFRRRSFNA